LVEEEIGNRVPLQMQRTRQERTYRLAIRNGRNAPFMQSPEARRPLPVADIRETQDQTTQKAIEMAT
jgi:hypothetical protein